MFLVLQYFGAKGRRNGGRRSRAEDKGRGSRVEENKHPINNGNIVKAQKDEPIAIETYLGGFILSGVIIDNINKESSINFNSTYVSRIIAEDNFINDYKE